MKMISLYKILIISFFNESTPLPFFINRIKMTIYNLRSDAALTQRGLIYSKISLIRNFNNSYILMKKSLCARPLDLLDIGGANP